MVRYTALAFYGRVSAFRQALRQARKAAMAGGSYSLCDPIAGPKIRRAVRLVQMDELRQQIAAINSLNIARIDGPGGDAA